MNLKDRLDSESLGSFLYSTLANTYKENELLVVNVEKIIMKGANINYQEPVTGNTLLTISIENRLYKIFKLLIKYQANLELQRKDKKTACHIAAQCGNSFYLKFLIENGANINHLDALSNSPLNDAIINSSLDNIILLVKSGARLNNLNLYGESIYDLAFKTQNKEVIDCINNIDYLLENDAIKRILRKILQH